MKSQDLKRQILEEFKEWYAPQDFKCGGCGECEACLYYFEKETYLPSLRKALTTLEQGVLGEVREKVEKMKLGGHKDEEKRIFAGGYDNAIDDVLSLISPPQRDGFKCSVCGKPSWRAVCNGFCKEHHEEKCMDKPKGPNEN